jgi:hypothetical protein
MDDRKRSIAEKLDYRIAVRRFESAFEVCERLPDADQQLLLKEIAKRISHRVLAAPPEEKKEDAVKIVGIEIKQAP